MKKPYEDLQDFARDFPDNKTAEQANLLKFDKMLDRAYEIRNFEINLYWKRASYFWGFLVASFTAYFIVIDSVKFKAKPEFEYLVMCIGFIFSLSWFLVNRGSKYWQQNWEKIIDTIEEIIKMPLYRVNLKNKNHILNLMKGFPHSVTQINQIVSLFICCVWLLLIVIFFFRPENKISFNKQLNLPILFFSTLTFIFSILLLFYGKSSKHGSSPYYLEKRESNYLVSSKTNK